MFMCLILRLFLCFTEPVLLIVDKLETSGGVIWMGPWVYSSYTRFEKHSSLDRGSFYTNTKVTNES